MTFHPEVVRVRTHFAEAVASPDKTRSSKYDESVVIHYKQIDGTFLAVVIKKSLQRNFILTAYLTSRIQNL